MFHYQVDSQGEAGIFRFLTKWGASSDFRSSRLTVKHYLIRYKFKLLTIMMIVSQIQSGDLVMINDLKCAYFSIKILPQQSVGGLTAAEPIVIPLGFRPMRPFQLWLGARRFNSRANLRGKQRARFHTLSIVFRPRFLTLGPTLDPSCHRRILKQTFPLLAGMRS